ncbi:MAG: hypothetical protein RLY87_981 [Chloroflexota bacterium]|jgi:alpha-tubulin suppressor-like RCC1 family protein
MKSRLLFLVMSLLCVAILVGITQRVPTTRADEARATTYAVTQIAAGEGHVCALFSNGTIKCWGYNGEGQLGYGDTVSRGTDATKMGANLATVDLGTGITATKVVAGEFFTCALLNTKQVKCWGQNNNAQLGSGSRTNIGNVAGQMGDNLSVVSIGSDRSVVDVVAGLQHVCVLLDNNAVKCWGGSINNGTGSAIGDDLSKMGDALAALDFGTTYTVKQLVSGGYQSCVLLSNGGVKCWGSNYGGNLGIGSTTDVGTGSDMGSLLAGVFLGTGRYATQLAMGSNHVCAVLDDATLKCWGYNTNGQLGIGSTANLGDSVSELGDNMPTVNVGTNRTVKQIYAGYSNTCALLDTGALKCWGLNERGTLADTTTVDKGTSAEQMGDALATMNFGGTLVVKQIAILAYDICALFTTGGIKCWGRNASGEAGCSGCNSHTSPLSTYSFVNLNAKTVTAPTLTKTKSPTRTRTKTKTLTPSKTFTRTMTRTSTLTPTPTP